MNDCERLADQVEKALDGGAWHGPSWREVLNGVSREAALDRPVPGAHTIAEIVLHTTTWHDVVRLRLLGESPQVADSEDWPAPLLPDDAAWDTARARLLGSGHELRTTVAAFPPTRLHERRPGLADTWYGLILGELQHTLYHAGQIPILQRAASRSI